MMHISIYPNPTSSYVNVSGDNLNRVEVFDMMGKMVWNKSCSENELSVDVHNWPAGTYMVRVTAQGNTTTRKVVVK